HCGYEVGIDVAYAGGQERCYAYLGLWSKVEPDHAGQMRWEVHARDRREHGGGVLGSDRRPVGKTRIPTWWWRFLGGHPPIQPRQGGTQQRRVIHTVEQLLAT